MYMPDGYDKETKQGLQGKKALSDITNWQEMSTACYRTSQRCSPDTDELSVIQTQFLDPRAPVVKDEYSSKDVSWGGCVYTRNDVCLN